MLSREMRASSRLLIEEAWSSPDLDDKATFQWMHVLRAQHARRLCPVPFARPLARTIGGWGTHRAR